MVPVVELMPPLLCCCCWLWPLEATDPEPVAPKLPLPLVVALPVLPYMLEPPVGDGEELLYVPACDWLMFVFWFTVLWLLE